MLQIRTFSAVPQWFVAILSSHCNKTCKMKNDVRVLMIWRLVSRIGTRWQVGLMIGSFPVSSDFPTGRSLDAAG